MRQRNPDYISIIVIASGLSMRSGRNRLLEPIGERTMIEYVASECLTSKAKQVVVVVGNDADKVKLALREFPCEIVFDEDFAKGTSYSIKKGLSAVKEDADGVMVVPGDIGLVDRSTINTIDPRVLDMLRPHRDHWPSQQHSSSHPLRQEPPRGAQEHERRDRRAQQPRLEVQGQEPSRPVVGGVSPSPQQGGKQDQGSAGSFQALLTTGDLAPVGLFSSSTSGGSSDAEWFSALRVWRTAFDIRCYPNRFG